MAKGKSRRAGRRVKDKWKSKSWYRIVAPDMFENSVVGETVASEPEDLIGRVTEITLQDLIGDFSKSHIKVQLKIQGVRGGECVTRFVGHDMTTDYIRRMTRRRRSKIDSVFDTRTKDGYKLRVKTLSVTSKRINYSKKNSIRKKQAEVIDDVASSSQLHQLVSKMLFGDLAKELKNGCKKAYPLKRVEIKKSEVLQMPGEEELEEKIVTEEELEEQEEEEEKEEAEEEEEEEEPEERPKTEVLEEFQSIEGVGPTMAEKLYDGGYRSMQELGDSSKDELTEVDGVGPAFSEKIYDALHEE